MSVFFNLGIKSLYFDSINSKLERLLQITLCKHYKSLRSLQYPAFSLSNSMIKKLNLNTYINCTPDLNHALIIGQIKAKKLYIPWSDLRDLLTENLSVESVEAFFDKDTTFQTNQTTYFFKNFAFFLIIEFLTVRIQESGKVRYFTKENKIFVETLLGLNTKMFLNRYLTVS